MMRNKLFAVLISIALLAMLLGCAGEQPDVVLFTPEAAEPAVEIQPQDAPETETQGDAVEIESVPCDLPLPGPPERTVILCEKFDDNRSELEVERQDNPNAKYTSAITDGKFVVDYAAKGFEGYKRTTYTWFTIGEGRNFALSLKGLMDSAFQDVSWGIAFRRKGDNFFLFSILNTGEYRFEIYENGGWDTLITTRIHNGIRLGEENSVRIEVAGRDLYFSINDVLVNQFSGAVLDGDEIQLVVSAKEGASATYTFDDVVLQR